MTDFNIYCDESRHTSDPTQPFMVIGAVRCPRERKMAVLAALAPFGARVLDVKMQEPSLEDVFFGFSD